MAKNKKRTNPRKIPLRTGSINAKELLIEASKGNMFEAWLLVLITLLDMEGMTPEKVTELWVAVNEYAADPAFTGERLETESRRAENLMGISAPYKGFALDASSIRSVGELYNAKQKLRKKALHSAMCIIALGIDSTNMFGADEIRTIFLNANLYYGEVLCGAISRDDMILKIRERGVNIQETDDDMVIV